MSRSNPTDGIKNPSTRWFEWAGGDEGGFVKWYDKEAKTDAKAPLPFTFLLLDELSAIKGWHEPSESGIYSNEVRDTRQDALVVRSFKGGDLASGIYTTIRDRIVAVGGHYTASIYLAYKEGDALRIGNLGLKGAAAGAWMEFKRSAPARKDANGKSVRGYFVDAVRIAEFAQEKKGATVYRVPKFSLAPVSEGTNAEALVLDQELQSFLAEYLKRPKSEAAKPQPTNGASDEEPPPPENDDEVPPAFRDFPSDAPF